MPYIIETTTRPLAPFKGETDSDFNMREWATASSSVTRVAVATLHEAREEAAHRIEIITGGDPDYEEIYTDAQGCSELGDTFGPLPDETVIEVRQVEWPALGMSGADVFAPPASEWQARVLAAFNAAA